MSNPLLGDSVTPTTIIAVGTVLPALASIAVGLRFYVRIARSTSIGVDDYLILLALVLTVGLGIAMIVGSAVHALAQPTPPGDGPFGFMFVLNKAIITTEKIKWPFNMLQVIILGSIKLSVLVFYRRIFRGQIFDICSKILMGIVAFWTCAFFFTVFFECGTEFWALWSTLDDLITQCLNEVMALKALTISDVITDALILTLPVPSVWNLQMSVKRRAAVCAMFLLGTLSVNSGTISQAPFLGSFVCDQRVWRTMLIVLRAVAAGLARVVIFVTQLNSSFSNTQGIMVMSIWDYWTMIELGLSIIAACLPTLRPLFKDAAPDEWSSLLRSWVGRGLSLSWTSRNHSGANYKGSETLSNSSDLGFVPKSKNSDFATEIYPMRDVESQSPVPASSIMVRNNITQTSWTH